MDITRWSDASCCAPVAAIPGNPQPSVYCCSIVTLLSGSKICAGNPDDKFKCLVSHYKGKFMDLHGTSTFTYLIIQLFIIGDKVIAYQDDAPFPHPTIRHGQCDILISSGRCDRCLTCEEYRYEQDSSILTPFHRKTLYALVSRHKSRSEKQ